jgi:hypothetical protein
MRIVMMGELDALKVVPFTQERIPNPYPGGELPWQIYHTVRNDIVQACRKHGPTGPMGVIKIDWDVDDAYRQGFLEPGFWESGDDDPMYYIIDDQYNHERYCYAELNGNAPFNAEWLLSVTAVLRKHKGWGLGVNHIPGGYVLIFGKRLMVKGRELSRCKSASEVVTVVSRLLRRHGKKWWQFWR